jgi:hypothetical protein
VTSAVSYWGWYPELGLELGAASSTTAFAGDVLDQPQDDQRNISRYLLSGSRVLSMRGRSVTDPLSTERSGLNDPDLVTDGVWVWPSVIGYFVYKYNLAVPGEFVDRMRQAQWDPPKPTPEQRRAVLEALGARPIDEPSRDDLEGLLRRDDD